MKKIILFFISVLMLLSVVVSAHPGSLDDNGGHYNRTTGEYHYHSGEHTESSPSSSYAKNHEEDYDDDDEESDTPIFFPLSIGGVYSIFILAGLIVAFLILWLIAEIEYERNRRNPYGGEAYHNLCIPIISLYILSGTWSLVCFSSFLRELPPRNTLSNIVKLVVLVIYGIYGLRLFGRLCDRLDELYS